MWEELYEKHYPELLRYAAAACRNQEEAEDAAQEVFLKALQNADVIQDLGPSQRRAWLYRTLKNTLCDRWRRGKQEEACLDTLEPEAASLDPGNPGGGKCAAAAMLKQRRPGTVPPAL